MSSHILLATVTGIALSTPAWAHDPAEAPIDTDIEAIFLGPAENIEAILLDPAEAPIDTEMKILWLENIEARLWGKILAVRSGLGSFKTLPAGWLHSRGTPAGTDERKPCRGLGRSAAFRRSSVLRPRPASRVPVSTARPRLRSSACMSACRERPMVVASFIHGMPSSRFRGVLDYGVSRRKDYRGNPHRAESAMQWRRRAAEAGTRAEGA